MSAVHSQSPSRANDCNIGGTLKVYQLIKHPYYQNCARYSIATVYVSKKHTEPKTKKGPKIPGMDASKLNVHTTSMVALFLLEMV